MLQNLAQPKSPQLTPRKHPTLSSPYHRADLHPNGIPATRERKAKTGGRHRLLAHDRPASPVRESLPVFAHPFSRPPCERVGSDLQKKPRQAKALSKSKADDCVNPELVVTRASGDDGDLINTKNHTLNSYFYPPRQDGLKLALKARLRVCRPWPIPAIPSRHPSQHATQPKA